MKVCLFLGSQFAPQDSPKQRLGELMVQVEWAERLGFHGVFVPHHYLAEFAYFQPIPLLSYLAARTNHVKLGTCVLQLPLLHPVSLAEELATLDVLSGGRLVVGFGQGYRTEEFEALGVPINERGRRISQYVPLLRRLWSGEEVTAAGPFGSLSAARLTLRPEQPGGPPIWIGANADKGIERAAKLGETWVASPGVLVPELARRLQLLRTTILACGGSLDRDYPVRREACIARTREQAIDIARPHLTGKYEAYRRWGKDQPDVEDMFADGAIIGTPEDAHRQIRRYADELGVTHLVLRVQWPGMDHELALQTIRLLGEEVLPALLRE